MTKYLTLLLLLVVIGSNAQNLTKVTSVADGTQILKPVGGYEASPIPVSAALDTARTLIYTVSFSRDTTQNVSITVYAYSRSGSLLYQTVLNMPGSTYRKWKALLTPLDAYIANQLKRITQLTN